LENFAGELLAISQANPNSDVFYCDSSIRFYEEANDRCHFKPAFSPYTLASRNFIGRSFAVRAHCIQNCEHAFSSPINHHALLLELYGNGCAFHHMPGVYYLEVGYGSTGDKQIEESTEAIEKTMTGSSALVSDLQQGYFDLRFPIDEKPLVSVIIPSRDAAEMCEKCLYALFNKTHYPNFEILLIDNGSKDPSFFSMIENWQHRFSSRFRVIRDDEAFNFSKLMNLGAQNASGSILLLMNNDVEVIHADWMERMVEFCLRKDVGVVTAKLLYPNDTIQHAGAILGLGDAAGHILVGANGDASGYFGNLVCLTEYSIMTAACMMVSKDIYWKVGGFDEAFPVEFNDFDFCLKVKALGKHNLMIPQVKLYHHESISRGHPRENPKTYKRYVGELNLFRSKWHNLLTNDPAYNPYLSKVFDDFRMG
jgi:GT2 family glycosyltransferase